MRKIDVSWNIKFEVTFYGVDQEEKSFREIKENIIKFDDNFEIPNKLPFDTKENVEINFLLWVDGTSPEKLVSLPHDYYCKNVKYGEESVEVLNKVGINSQEASALIVVTQHYDTLQAVGADTNSNLILLPNSPQAGSDMLNNMVASFTASNQIGEAMKKQDKKKNSTTDVDK